MPGTDVFPTLHCCTRLIHIDEHESLYDVKFYPYPTLEDDQIFAVAGVRDVIICRPKLNSNPPFELLKWFKDADEEASFNSLVWTKDPITRRPLLCVAGAKPKQIKILDADTGEPVRTLPGHGKGINDLAISPLSTSLLASASEDYTIRLWNLDPKHEKQPCVAILSGEGHRQPILAAQFHPNGRWLISGGLDTAICVWAVPTLDELENTDEVMLVHYPLFHSTEVHHNYVDSVAFYGNLILSRAAKDPIDKSNEIILWRIEGFESDAPPPSRSPVPEPGVSTRSAFSHGQRSQFQRLLTFAMPNTARFYHRFGLLHAPDMHPILCMGNQMSKFYFWDLQKLEEGWDVTEEAKWKAGKARGRKGKAANSLDAIRNLGLARNDETSSTFSDSTGIGGRASTPMQSSTSISAPTERKYALGDPFLPIPPHFTATPQTNLTNHKHFATSQMAWSADGTWLVSVGDRGVMCIFHRDKSVVNGVPKVSTLPLPDR